MGNLIQMDSDGVCARARAFRQVEVTPHPVSQEKNEKKKKRGKKTLNTST